MRFRGTKKQGLVLSFILCTIVIYSHGVYAGGTGAAFLKIAPDSKASGMGGAYTALADSVSALWWNPGGLARMTKSELSGTHVEWFAGTSYDFIGYAHPCVNGTFAAGISTLDAGSMESRDAAGNMGGNFSARDLSVSLAYAAQLDAGTHLGISVKYIKQSIESEDAIGYCFDIGGITALGFHGLDMGYGLYNLGPKMRFLYESYHLPLAMVAGLGYKITDIRIAMDVHRDYHAKKTYCSLGMDYAVLPVLSLRMGYLQNALRGNTDGMNSVASVFGMNGLNAGFGIKLLGHQLDYAFIPLGKLGSTHRMSITTQF